MHRRFYHMGPWVDYEGGYVLCRRRNWILQGTALVHLYKGSVEPRVNLFGFTFILPGSVQHLVYYIDTLYAAGLTAE